MSLFVLLGLSSSLGAELQEPAIQLSGGVAAFSPLRRPWQMHPTLIGQVDAHDFLGGLPWLGASATVGTGVYVPRSCPGCGVDAAWRVGVGPTLVTERVDVSVQLRAVGFGRWADFTPAVQVVPKPSATGSAVIRPFVTVEGLRSVDLCFGVRVVIPVESEPEAVPVVEQPQGEGDTPLVVAFDPPGVEIKEGTRADGTQVRVETHRVGSMGTVITTYTYPDGTVVVDGQGWTSHELEIRRPDGSRDVYQAGQVDRVKLDPVGESTEGQRYRVSADGTVSGVEQWSGRAPEGIDLSLPEQMTVVQEGAGSDGQVQLAQTETEPTFVTHDTRTLVQKVETETLSDGTEIRKEYYVHSDGSPAAMSGTRTVTRYPDGTQVTEVFTYTGRSFDIQHADGSREVYRVHQLDSYEERRSKDGFLGEHFRYGPDGELQVDEDWDGSEPDVLHEIREGTLEQIE